MQKTLLTLALATTLPAYAPASAEQTRQLDAHEHGVGSLNIAIDGTTVSMAFEAPGFDVVGFEYAAQSEADLAAVEAAKATLSAPLDLFVLPKAAACVAQSVEVALESDHDHDDHDHGEEHAKHDDDHDDHDHGEEHAKHDDDHDDHDHGEEHAKHDDAHDDHDHGEEHAKHDDAHDDHDHDEEHAKHDDDHDDHDHDEEHAKHDDDDHDAGAGHTEFHAQYMFTCDTPEALTEITFAYFEAFPNAKEVEVQVISTSGAQAFDVERNDPVLQLGR